MTTERKPHKWSEVIKAWADGKPIQFKVGESEWIDWNPDQLRQSNASAMFFPFYVPRFDQFEWRVKPENIVVSVMAYLHMDDFIQLNFQDEPNLRLEFDHDTKKLVKAEVIR